MGNVRKFARFFGIAFLLSNRLIIKKNKTIENILAFNHLRKNYKVWSLK